MQDQFEAYLQAVETQDKAERDAKLTADIKTRNILLATCNTRLLPTPQQLNELNIAYAECVRLGLYEYANAYSVTSKIINANQ